MSDFSDRPLVAGSLIGLRAFGVDKLGRLNSIYNAVPFRPGENEAECRKATYEANQIGFGWTHTSFNFTVTREMMGLPPESPEEKAEREAKREAKKAEEAARKAMPHTVAGVNCTCGFYAYFDGRNDYKSRSDHNAAALIEGYGICSVGDRGFRSAKARLVALITPQRMDNRWDRVLHNYPDVPVYDRKREAIAAHPLTPPEVPTPETCEDFWERHA